MKKSFFICIGIASTIFLLTNLKLDDVPQVKYQNQNTIPHLPIIRVVVYQDVSGSIKQNGVVVISSSVFTPYFAETHRTIELSFGCVTDSSAHKLITVLLPARAFCAPSAPDLDRLSFTERFDVRTGYYDAEKRYVADSQAYFTDRHERIEAFQKQVDALLRLYRDHPAPRTDIADAVAIADKQFMSSMLDNSWNFLILNSDGEDTYTKRISPLKNPATVILTNASAITNTSLDALHPINLQSVEQAIQFTLNVNHKIVQK